MDDSTAECADASCGGVASGKTCLWGDVSDGSSELIRHLLIPPVEELLGVR